MAEVRPSVLPSESPGWVRPGGREGAGARPSIGADDRPAGRARRGCGL